MGPWCDWAMRLALDPAKAGPQTVELRIRGGELVDNGRLTLSAEDLAGAVGGPINMNEVDRADNDLNGLFNWPAKELAPGFKISSSDIVVDVGSGDGQMAAFCAKMPPRRS